jgi:hypothetical protein
MGFPRFCERFNKIRPRHAERFLNKRERYEVEEEKPLILALREDMKKWRNDGGHHGGGGGGSKDSGGDCNVM